MRVTRTDTSQVQISDVNVISVEKLGKVLEEQGLPLDTPFEVEYTAKGYYIKTVTFTNRTFRG